MWRDKCEQPLKRVARREQDGWGVTFGRNLWTSHSLHFTCPLASLPTDWVRQRFFSRRPDKTRDCEDWREGRKEEQRWRNCWWIEKERRDRASIWFLRGVLSFYFEIWLIFPDNDSCVCIKNLASECFLFFERQEHSLEFPLFSHYPISSHPIIPLLNCNSVMIDVGNAFEKFHGTVAFPNRNSCPIISLHWSSRDDHSYFDLSMLFLKRRYLFGICFARNEK